MNFNKDNSLQFSQINNQKSFELSFLVKNVVKELFDPGEGTTYMGCDVFSVK
jgi:hypothetical protein